MTDIYSDAPSPKPPRKHRTPISKIVLNMALERERKRFEGIRQHCDITHCYNGLAGSWIGDERGSEAADYQRSLIEDEAPRAALGAGASVEESVRVMACIIDGESFRLSGRSMRRMWESIIFPVTARYNRVPRWLCSRMSGDQTARCGRAYWTRRSQFATSPRFSEDPRQMRMTTVLDDGLDVFDVEHLSPTTKKP